MTRARRVAAGVACVGALLVGVAPLAAQPIAGSVRDSTSRLAIPGAVVTAFARDGSQIASVLTNERGEFRVLATGVAEPATAGCIAVRRWSSWCDGDGFHDERIALTMSRPVMVVPVRMQPRER